MARLTDAAFISAWERCGGATVMAKELGMDRTSLLKRRNKLQAQGYKLLTRPAPGYESRTPQHHHDARWTFPREIPLTIDTGSVIVASDCHYWPGDMSLAHKALLHVIRQEVAGDSAAAPYLFWGLHND